MGLLEFLTGAAVVVLPKGNAVLLAVGVTATVVRSAARRRRERKASHAVIPHESSRAFLATHEALTHRVVPATLEWSQINCEVKIRSKNERKAQPRRILKNVEGSAEPGRLLAIMGPSGSGKTTLLSTLAGQVPRTKGMTLSGQVFINGEPVADSHARVAYIQQEDLFYSQLTLQETLEMAAALRLPRSTTAAQRDEVVQDVMQRMGLSKSAQTIVGDAKTRGLSGGEKKRLSIACALIASPSLIFLDEPTTGLDAFQAQKVVEGLHDLAAAGHTVVCSIHQPRSSIYALFDDLLLMGEGSPLYLGPADQATAAFQRLGHVCPPHSNPAEFLADLISLDFSSPEREAESRSRVATLAAAFQPSATGAAAAAAANGADAAAPHVLPAARGRTSQAGFWQQVRLLLKRSWRQVSRDGATNKLRLATSVQSAIVFGCIWWRLRLLQSGILSRFGLLQVAAVSNAQSVLFRALRAFPSEKTLVNQERAGSSYGAGAYLAAKLAAELPVSALFPVAFGAVMYPMTGLQAGWSCFTKFLGITVLEAWTASIQGMALSAVSPSTDFALVLGPAVSVVFIVFGGLYTTSDDVPRVLKWVPTWSLIQQAYKGYSVNEMSGLEFEGGDVPGGMATGEAALERYGYGDATVAGAAGGLGRILLLHYWITYNVLKSGGPRFQPLLAPQDAPASSN